MSGPVREVDEPVGPLRTVSLRLRVTATVTAVVALVVLVLGVVVDRVFVAQSERNLTTLLVGRAQLARQLARTGVGPQQIVNRVAVSGVDATLTLPTGVVFGVPAPPGVQTRTVQTTLAGPGRVDGAELVLAVDADLAERAQRALRRILIVAGFGAVVLSALLVALAARYALAPLSTMADLARSIADGRRGTRLTPTRRDTELGRTAGAFDDMLDELEGAEARAVTSEARTRAFLADAAHELRTPVTGIQAAAETLLHQGSLTAAQREQLEVLLIGEARRAGTLITDLLAAARLDADPALHLGEVDLTALVAAERDRLAVTAPRLTVDVRGATRPLTLDRDKITGVLRNLVDNAVRAAGDHGRIVLDLRDVPTGAQLMIMDSGPGVPTADRDRIFDRLVRLDTARSTPGSGLGLAIARGWTEAHGGTLQCVDPPPGVPGAAFVLTLPQAAREKPR